MCHVIAVVKKTTKTNKRFYLYCFSVSVVIYVDVSLPWHSDGQVPVARYSGKTCGDARQHPAANTVPVSGQCVWVQIGSTVFLSASFAFRTRRAPGAGRSQRRAEAETHY